MVKRVGVLFVILFSIYAFSCVTTTEKKPEMTQEELKDSAKVWYSIGKDYLVKAEDNRATYEDAIRNFRKSLYYASHLKNKKDTLTLS